MRQLDLDQLRAFAIVADLRSFTAAGETLGATQSAISLRIAKLEEQLGRRLLARTPRAVSLTLDGTRFLPHAQAVLAAHDAALARWEAPHGERTMLRLAVSDHAAGGFLVPALRTLRASLPLVMPDVVVGPSVEMRELYDRGEADAAIVRHDPADRREGTPLGADPLVWSKAPALVLSPEEPIPLVALRSPCSVKTAATRALEQAGRPWRFAFLGGSVMSLQAAVEAGLGLGAFGQRHVPPGCAVDGDTDLPPLPESQVMLLTRLDGPVRRALEAAFRSGRSASA